MTAIWYIDKSECLPGVRGAPWHGDRTRLGRQCVPVNQDKWADVKESGENYRAFLLRCWQEPEAGHAGEAAWRFTLVEAGNEEGKRGFARLEKLVGYLQEELGEG